MNMDAGRIQGIRGMPDVDWREARQWEWLERQAAAVLAGYGYQEVRLPLLEMKDLFSRAVGTGTDIVAKEMYCFQDRQGDWLALRPEGTAVLVRAGLQHDWFRHEQRFWYRGAMFRHERPQKGRYRQFHQIGAEVIGPQGPDVDAELILLAARLLQELGVGHLVRLKLNSLGSPASRRAHRAALLAYLRTQQLPHEALERAERNPLRLFDSKDEKIRAVMAQAPCLQDYWDADSKEYFARLIDLLQACGVAYDLTPQLVRGLDYYNLTVFEWVTDQLGAQDTVLAGGRYDALCALLGGAPYPGAGFAMGLERLLALMQVAHVAQSPMQAAVFVASMGEQARAMALGLGETLRTMLAEEVVMVHTGEGSFKGQMRRAERYGAKVVLLLGEEEVARQEVTIKSLHHQGKQQRVPMRELSNVLPRWLADASNLDQVALPC